MKAFELGPSMMSTPSELLVRVNFRARQRVSPTDVIEVYRSLTPRTLIHMARGGRRAVSFITVVTGGGISHSELECRENSQGSAWFNLGQEPQYTSQYRY